MWPLGSFMGYSDDFGKSCTMENFISNRASLNFILILLYNFLSVIFTVPYRVRLKKVPIIFMITPVFLHLFNKISLAYFVIHYLLLHEKILYLPL